MSDANTRGCAEPSPASAGSHGEACRAAFERWADADGRFRTIKKTNGSYLDSPARWAWEGWRAAALTDEERDAIAWFADYGDLQSEARRAEVLKGLLGRLG